MPHLLRKERIRRKPSMIALQAEGQLLMESLKTMQTATVNTAHHRGLPGGGGAFHPQPTKARSWILKLHLPSLNIRTPPSLGYLLIC